MAMLERYVTMRLWGRHGFAVLLAISVACAQQPAHPAASAHAASSATPAASGGPASQASACVDEPGMAYIPGGAHRARDEDYFWQAVQVEPFWLDRYEVTVEQYRECVDAGACKRPHPSSSGYTDAKLNPLVCTWEIDDMPKLPINCVDGDDQDAFCGWAGKRAPIAFEWSWAAQGREEKRRYPWGEDPPTCELAIVDTDLGDAERGCGAQRPWPVGSRPADRTRDGVFDMEGNVGERTIEPFHAKHPRGYLRAMFGHSWRTAPNPRGVNSSSPSNRENFSDNSGFRCAKDAGEQPACTIAD